MDPQSKDARKNTSHGNRRYRGILRISYKDCTTNVEEVRAKIQQTIGSFIRSGQTLLLGKVKGGRRQGRQRKRWEDNMREWTCLAFAIFLYACESWTLTAELQRRMQAMEIRCYHWILRISYKDHVTNEEVRAKIQQAIGPHEDLLTIVKRCKLKCY